LRRLRQDSIIRIRSSIAGSRCRNASTRSTSAARRWSRSRAGEPLIHKDIGEIVKGIVARKKFVSLCTNALLLEKKLDLFTPSPYLFFSVHLDGLKEHHDKSVCQDGVFDRAVSAIKAAKARGFAGQRQRDDLRRPLRPRTSRRIWTSARSLGVGVSISPGYAYERAPDQQHFLARKKHQGAVPQGLRDSARARSGVHALRPCSSTFLPAIRKRTAPVGACRRATVFGWQKPCYLLGEGLP
jgi:hopanoid biosynthesis associated radical SAM protein HpnH